MAELSFTVPWGPVAQPRHRFGLRGGKPAPYLPADHPVNAFKDAVRLYARVAVSDARLIKPLDGPLRVRLRFVLARTKADRSPAWHWHDKKPDLDNLVKAVLDGLLGLALSDDARVCDLAASKVVAAPNEEPGVSVRVEEI